MNRTVLIILSAVGLTFQTPGSETNADFILVTAGGIHACALDKSGQVWCWGSNIWGQVGNGEMDASAGQLPVFGLQSYGTEEHLKVIKPVAVKIYTRFISVSAGDRHTCGLTENHEIYCWGHGRFGQLGNGTTDDSSVPVQVSGDLKFKSLSSGGTHSCVITMNDKLFCWGGNWHGQLGTGIREPYSNVPRHVDSNKTFSMVSAGGIHTCAITLEGKAYCWGDYRSGRLGIDSRIGKDQFRPVKVNTDIRFNSIFTGPGSGHNCALTGRNELYCWGAMTEAYSGLRRENELLYIPSRFQLDNPVKAVTMGAFYTCLLDHAGIVFCAGTNRTGKPGEGSKKNHTFFRQVQLSEKAVSVSAGGNTFFSHTCAAVTSGEIYCWGDNSRGQLGSVNKKSSAKPVLVILK